MWNNQNQQQLKELMNDPMEAARRAGYNIPQEMTGDPKAMVQHLIMTGQVASPMLQRIMPMIRQMGGKV